MDENIIIPIKVDEGPALQRLKTFSTQARTAIGSIGTGRNGEINLDVRVRTNNAPTELRGVGAAAGVAGNALRGLKPGASQAENAMLNLNRVLQDSPYGLIGIQNNLNPLLESFQRLRKETGSNKAAMSALVSSLMGGGGLGLALAAVGAAMTFAQIGLTMWTRKKNEAKQATDELKKAEEELQSIQNQAYRSTAQQVSKLNELVAIVNNTSTSTKNRAEALRELQKLYPSYFSNLGVEAANTASLANVVAQLTNNLKAASRARVITGQMDMITDKQLKAEDEHINNRERLIKADRELLAAKVANKQFDDNRFKDISKFSMKDALAGEERVRRAQQEYDGAFSAMKGSASSIRETTVELDKLNSKVQEVKTGMGPLKVDGTDLLAGMPKDRIKNAANDTKAFAEAQKQLTIDSNYLLQQYQSGRLSGLEYAKLKFDLLNKSAEEFVKKFGQAPDGALISGMLLQIDSLQAVLGGDRKISFSTIREQVKKSAEQAFNESANVDIPIQANVNILLADADKMKAQLAMISQAIELGIKKFRWKGHLIPFDVSLDPAQMKEALSQATTLQAEFNRILEGTLENGITALADGIGNALVTGDWAGMFKGVKNLMGAAMQDFGKFLIVSAVTIEAAKKAAAWAVAHPVAAVAAGAALVALGAALKANVEKRSSQKMTGFAHGGGVTGPGIALVGEHSSTSKTNPELWGRFDQFKGLFGSMINDYAHRTNRALPATDMGSGGYPSEILLRADGDSLVGLLTRTQNRQHRNY